MWLKATTAFAVCIGFASIGSDAMAQGKKSSGSAPAVDVSTLNVCPSNATSIAEAMTCRCDSGGPLGSVWGSGPYTADSSVCTAATHAGVIGTNGGGLTITMQPGQSSYSGTTSNGVTTGDWGSYDKSFAISAVGQMAETTLPACDQMPDGTNTHACSCDANFSLGSLWGSGPYTADSDICSAARHAGYIDESGGEVFVLRVQGLSGYYGQESYGVSSSDWGSYDSSIVFDWNK